MRRWKMHAEFHPGARVELLVAGAANAFSDFSKAMMATSSCESSSSFRGLLEPHAGAREGAADGVRQMAGREADDLVGERERFL